jgi:hypothetical protein
MNSLLVSLNKLVNSISPVHESTSYFLSFDEYYPTIESMIEGVKKGELLIHARKSGDRDPKDFKYGLEPSAGSTLTKTDAYWQAQASSEETGENYLPELIFMSDQKLWMGKERDQVLFIKKDENMQQSLGDGKVRLMDGNVISYERGPVADYELPAYKAEPAGVETNDWYSRKTVEVVGVADSDLVLSHF